MEPSRVTVLVPTYNRAHWVGGAIESILAQTYADFHLVVSDNASTDATREVVARFGDPRLTYVRRDVNCGLNEHYNSWFERVETEYLFIVPDDDRLAPDARRPDRRGARRQPDRGPRPRAGRRRRRARRRHRAPPTT